MKGNSSSIRWHDLLKPLKAKAIEEGTTVSGLVTRLVRQYLGMEVSASAKDKESLLVGIKLSAFDPVPVRLGRFGPLLEERARAEKVSSSELLRRAARLYLANGEVPKILQFMDELRKAHADMARVGGNLNRIARLINTDEILAKSELALVHRALIEEFKPLAKLYGRVERELERQKP